jgi:hypothetical protein
MRTRSGEMTLRRAYSKLKRVITTGIRQQQTAAATLPAITRHHPSDLRRWPLLTFLPLVYTEEVTGSIPVSPTSSAASCDMRLVVGRRPFLVVDVVGVCSADPQAVRDAGA